MKGEALKLCWNTGWDKPRIALDEVHHLVITRKLKEGESLGCGNLVNPIVLPQQDRVAIPQYPTATNLQKVCQRSNPFPNAGPSLGGSRKPDRGIPTYHETRKPRES